ncbi:putative HTH-type transcriptional regulator YtcD [Corynebacterium atrinae]|uniref:winged helix-turn-helix transcriptional regulator n=1 Tax=Corynebacterium atrinae TaxID=1336740 RepID=UPI0025B56B2B|nr:helix-turn-helix domain-containing protein [Corynebacterium atrinae]WJY63777.1 putative HTH-type transcriptional regulator YtcD [Corynebacterium atrinae]
MDSWARDVDPFDRTCRSRGLLATLADKWSILIIVSLDGQHMRYSDLDQAVDGISPKMLTQRLHTLVGDGLIRRIAHDEIPPRVVYSLTELGSSLLPVFYPFVGWLIEHTADVEDYREQQLNPAEDA